MTHKPPCSVVGCDLPIRSREMCSIHYDRWIRNGRKDVGPSHRLWMVAAGRTCVVDGCDRAVRCRGLCSRHYDQGRRVDSCPRCGGTKKSNSALCASCRVQLADVRPDEKLCRKCGVVKAAKEFGWRTDGRGRSKLRSQCRACATAYARVRRDAEDPEVRARRRAAVREAYARRLAADPERRFWISIRSSARRLGFDIDAVVRYVAEHGNVCQACGRSCDGGPRIQLDHDHGTGEFRGLLCGDCNWVAGHVSDDPDRLELIVTYLRTAHGLSGDPPRRLTR